MPWFVLDLLSIFNVRYTLKCNLNIRVTNLFKKKDNTSVQIFVIIL